MEKGKTLLYNYLHKTHTINIDLGIFVHLATIGGGGGGGGLHFLTSGNRTSGNEYNGSNIIKYQHLTPKQRPLLSANFTTSSCYRNFYYYIKYGKLSFSHTSNYFWWIRKMRKSYKVSFFESLEEWTNSDRNLSLNAGLS